MRALIERIRAEGVHLGGGILKVDSIINHQLDPDLMSAMGLAFAKCFADLRDRPHPHGGDFRHCAGFDGGQGDKCAGGLRAETEAHHDVRSGISGDGAKPHQRRRDDAAGFG